jgi:outer membrane protein assembly factor BamE (lipoprotein component of BamABCDE complex)
MTWLLSNCSSTPDTFGKLDLKKWRSDRGGCNSVRQTILPGFRAEIQNLKGKTANTIGDLLGRPDINQIADRNQKFYIYFIEKGIHCDTPGAKSNSRSVAIRFNAIGLATEITFQNGIP